MGDKKLLQLKQKSIQSEIDNVMQEAAKATEANFHTLEGFMDNVNAIGKDLVDFKEKLLEYNAAVDEEEELDLNKEILKASSDIAVIRGKFYKIKASIDNAKALQSPTTSTPGSTLNNTSCVSKMKNHKLDKIHLKQFDGDISKWLSFIGLFNRMVHENQELSDLEKFEYLLTNVQGEALTIVERYEFIEANYKVAYLALKARYDSKRLLLSHIVQQLINYKPSNVSNNKFDLVEYLSVHESVMYQLAKSRSQNYFNDFYFQLCYFNLPYGYRQKVDEKFNTDDIPSITDFFAFILTLSKSSSIREHEHANEVKSNKNFLVRNENGSKMCLLCPNELHFLYVCPKFISMTVDERFKFVKENNICFNCLRVRNKNHSPCPWKKNCRICNKPHNSLLHKDFQSAGRVGTGNNTVSSAQAEPTQVNADEGKKNYHMRLGEEESGASGVTLATTKQPTWHPPISQGHVLLGTISAFARNIDVNQAVQVTCLLDQCSEISLITKDSVLRLGLKINQVKQEIEGVEGIKAQCLGKVNFILYKSRSMLGCFSIEVDAYVVEKITSPLPSHDLYFSHYNKMVNFDLADKLFYKRKEINILLGCKVFCRILDNPKDGRTYIEGSPTLFWTKFGYVAMGNTGQESEGSKKTFITTLADLKAENSLAKAAENYEDFLAEEFYQKTSSRDPDGTYIVSLPFQESKKPNVNEFNATTRLSSLEKKTSHDGELKIQHHDHFKDYLESGHMSIATSAAKYLIPYHYVVKPDATSTQYRAVFDASSHDPGSLSLNDCLLKGPNLFNDMSNILIKFQVSGKYTLTADLSKCYRRIKINDKDAAYQHCLYQTENSQILELQLNCVVFGIKPSPFLALRTLQQLVKDEGSNYPLASEVILNNFYSDNCVLSESSIEKLKAIIQELEEILAKGNFPVHKFSSNSKEILDSIPAEKKEMLQVFTLNNQGIKVLGLKYDNSKDEFLFIIKDKPCMTPTKRSVLSYVLNLFDPQGFLSPVTFWAKIFINSLWKANLKWDAPLTGDLLNQWNVFAAKLWHLQDVRIPRYIPADRAVELNLIGTCDASKLGMAANVYLQCILDDHTIYTQLLKAKTRVAPRNEQSTPRLELDAAVLLSGLLKRVIEALPFLCSHVVLLSDSQVAVSWITNQSKTQKLSVYVENRVQLIRGLTKGYLWDYIPGDINPSDLATRGLDAAQFLKQEQLWFRGPELFRTPFISDLYEKFKIMHIKKKEERPPSPLVDFNKYLNLSKDYDELLRIFSYALRFAYSFGSKAPKKEEIDADITKVAPLTVHDLEASKRLLSRFSQAIYFKEDIEIVKHNQKSENKKKLNSSLQCLNPQLTPDGLLIVGGRLDHSNLSDTAKHPIILSSKCSLSAAIITRYHKKYFHAGPSLTLALTRQNFWITNGKSLIKKIISECNRCLRFNGKPMQQIMASLPKERVTCSRPFSYTGCDAGGPILIKSSKLRKAPQIKAYFIIFVCFATKACHIEALTELSTRSFLTTFDRFTSRRGLVKCLYSDCGTNFVGANRQIKEVTLFFKENSNELFSALASRNVEWQFNPPASPHMGGIWERQVRSIKEHLYKQVDPVVLTYEEFSTILCYIEAILNSRPLQPLDSDPDNVCLTPAHFLIGDSLLAVPRESLDLEKTMKNRWLMVQQKCQAIWHRWHKEYLHHLQQRFKWQQDHPDLKVGQVVYMTDINTAPLNYPMGKVIEVYLSKDGHVRSAKVKTSSGIYVRPVVKLIPLSTDLD